MEICPQHLSRTEINLGQRFQQWLTSVSQVDGQKQTGNGTDKTTKYFLIKSGSCRHTAFKLDINMICVAGDRWLVQCLGCLYSSKGLFYRVVPADQGFHSQDGYAGIFRSVPQFLYIFIVECCPVRFRIWWCGTWREVLVDDRLPTVNNKLVFISTNRSTEFWPALLEKAYAKYVFLRQLFIGKCLQMLGSKILLRHFQW